MTSTSTHRNSTSRPMLSTWTKGGRPTRSSRWKPTTPTARPNTATFAATTSSTKINRLPSTAKVCCLFHFQSILSARQLFFPFPSPRYCYYSSLVAIMCMLTEFLPGTRSPLTGSQPFVHKRERGRKKEGRKAIRLRWQFTGERERETESKSLALSGAFST